MAQRKRKSRESFGKIRKLPSGRYQASYIGLDLKRHTAPSTFTAIADARAWLEKRRTEKERGVIPELPVSDRRFDEFAAEWIRTRVSSKGQPLRPRTRAEYERLLRGPLAPFAGRMMRSIAPGDVRTWYAALQASGKATTAARAYQLLKAVLDTAMSDRIIDRNPCQVRGAVKASTGKKVEPPTAGELKAIVGAIDKRFRLLVLLAAWGGFRWGELTELRRGDIRFIADGELVAVDITRAVTYTKETGWLVGEPKSDAGVRSVTLPASLTAAVREHLDAIDPRETALLFPAAKNPDEHLQTGSFAMFWRAARKAAKRPDMPFHALRHYGATRFAQTGATLKEIQARIGHSTVEAAMRYQHAAGRDAELARLMDDLA